MVKKEQLVSDKEQVPVLFKAGYMCPSCEKKLGPGDDNEKPHDQVIKGTGGQTESCPGGTPKAYFLTHQIEIETASRLTNKGVLNPDKHGALSSEMGYMKAMDALDTELPLAA